MAISTDGGIAITLGALYATTLPRAMRGRIRHGRGYELRGGTTSLGLQPGDACAVISDDGDGAGVELRVRARTSSSTRSSGRCAMCSPAATGSRRGRR